MRTTMRHTQTNKLHAMYKKIRLCALLIIVALASACQKDLTLGGAEKFVQGETQTFTFNQEGETKMVDMAALGDQVQVSILMRYVCF